MTRQLLVALFALVIVIALAIMFPEFINIPALILTVGGACVVTASSYSRRELRSLMSALQTLFGETRRQLPEHMAELSRLTRLYRIEGLKGLENQEAHIVDPFLRRGVTLLVDLDKEETVAATLSHELIELRTHYHGAQQILLMLGKTLPAFGLIGTLVGMVLLLRPQAGGEVELLPEALSVAVLTTLYGAATANIVVAPLAARLRAVAQAEEAKMQLTLEWVMTLIRGETLPPPQRNGGRTLIAASPASAEAAKTWSAMALPLQR